MSELEKNLTEKVVTLENELKSRSRALQLIKHESQRSDQFLQNIFQSISEFVIVLNADVSINTINEAAENVLGYQQKLRYDPARQTRQQLIRR